MQLLLILSQGALLFSWASGEDVKLIGAQESPGSFWRIYGNLSAPEECVKPAGTQVDDSCCVDDSPIPLKDDQFAESCIFFQAMLPTGESLMAYMGCDDGVDTYGEACYNDGENGGIVPAGTVIEATNAKSVDQCGCCGCAFVIRGKGCWKIRNANELPGFEADTNQAFLWLDDPMCFRDIKPEEGHVVVWNTLTAFAPETIVDVSGPVDITDEIEFPLFPVGAFYEIDVTSSTISMTLKDNSPASVLVFPDGVADRYYFDLGKEVTSVALTGEGKALNEFTSVSVIEPGTEFDMNDDRYVGIALPIVVANGGVLVEIGAGADIGTLGVQVMLQYETKEDTSGAVATNMAVTALVAAVIGMIM